MQSFAKGFLKILCVLNCRSIPLASYLQRSIKSRSKLPSESVALMQRLQREQMQQAGVNVRHNEMKVKKSDYSLGPTRGDSQGQSNLVAQKWLNV